MIVSVLVSLLVFCNFVKKWYFNKYFKNVPEPAPCWPLLGHSPSFFIEKDHSSWHLKNTEQFRSFGLYRLRHILCMYIYLIILDCYSRKENFLLFFYVLAKFFLYDMEGGVFLWHYIEFLLPLYSVNKGAGSFHQVDVKRDMLNIAKQSRLHLP